MEARVKKLREISESTEPRISFERARLVTKAYQMADSSLSLVEKRALVFETIMTEKALYFQPSELIVGERGDSPWSAPTYPELCCHTAEDFRLVNSRERIRFKVEEQDIAYHVEEIVPFWQQRSIRNQIIEAMTPEWQQAYGAGIFTEFMEQRSPGHTVADQKVFTLGMKDLQHKITERLSRLEKEEVEKAQQLKAMAVVSKALVTYAQRYSVYLMDLAKAEKDPKVQAELFELSRITAKVPFYAPETFHEALQHYWFIHLGVITELNTWDAFSPGRLDQHLYPFYVKGLEDGTLTEAKVKELLGCFWVKFNNQPAPPKVGVTLKESSTYTDFANISLGGMTPDGEDGVNPLTYIILEVINEMQLLQPSTNIQVAQVNPDSFILSALDVIKEGRGQPSVFNADSVVKELMRQGKTLVDAREGGTSGCVETGAFGKEAYILTGYFNLVKILDITLHNGYDTTTKQQLGIQTGSQESLNTFEGLMAAFSQQVDHFLDIKLKGNDAIEKIYAEQMPCPYLSLWIDDCIENAKDYNRGGARYNSRYIQGVGIGTITDTLSAIKTHVYDSHKYSLAGLMSILDQNFENHELDRQFLINKTPAYGNDDDRADDLMKQVFELYFSKVDGRPTPTGGTYRINMLPTTCHVYFGAVIGATADGRKANMPLSEGISPVQGKDLKGPSAVIKSAGKMDHIKTGGTLLNMKFAPEFLKELKGKTSVKDLIRAYFLMNGHHIQFNVIKKETLIKAQQHPEQFKNLIVRVAGYSDYFNNLQKELQDEIINRKEHDGIGA